MWGEPSVDNSATLSDLAPGEYYFICTVSGHCDAGMKISVTVLPDDGLPVISNPVVSICSIHGSRCAFAYSRDDTPQLFGVEVHELSWLY